MAQTTTQYTMQDVANYAYRAGFRGADLAIATAIGWAESDGVSNAASNDGYNSHGFWQFIPSTWNEITNGSAFSNADNPQANANAAYALKQKSGWGQWSTYTSGKYLKNMPQATAAAANATKTQGKGSKSDGTSQAFLAQPTSLLGDLWNNPLNPLAPLTGGSGGGSSSGVGGFVTSIFKPLVDYAVDAGLVVGGVILMIFGILELFHEVKK